MDIFWNCPVEAGRGINARIRASRAIDIISASRTTSSLTFKLFTSVLHSQNASDFDNLPVKIYLEYPLANIFVQSSMSPKQGEKIASGLTTLLVEKNRTNKTLQVH